mmetsp:Transcript_1945/g.3943  ORF Transcript_1945/g.3943 Transcript_1945/m.3943 type:complete len:404 (+) Transcript_1945:447-1658(+)
MQQKPATNLNSRSAIGALLLTCLLYFYQVVPLIVAHFQRSAMLSRMSAAVGALSLQFTSDTDNSVCLAPNIDSTAKIALNFAIPLMLFFWISVSLAATALHRLVSRRTGVLQNSQPRTYFGPVMALFAGVELAYSTLLRSTFELLLCVPVEDESRMLLAGDTVCFTPWQRGVTVMVVPLTLIPFGFILAAVKVKRGISLAQDAVWESLCLALRRNTRFFAAQFLLRRLVLITVATFTQDPVSRGFSLFILCCFCLDLDLRLKAYRNPSVQEMAEYVDFGLLILSGINLCVAWAPERAEQSQFLQETTLVLTLTPFIVLPFTLRRRLLRRFRARRKETVERAQSREKELLSNVFQQGSSQDLDRSPPVCSRLVCLRWELLSLRIVALHSRWEPLLQDVSDPAIC